MSNDSPDLPSMPDPFASDVAPRPDAYPPSAPPYAGGAMAPTMVAPPPPPPPPAAPAADSGGLAITGLVFAIIAMLGPLLALFAAFARLPGVAGLLLLATIPLAIIAIVLSVAGRTSLRQRASAGAGMVLGIVALVLAVGVLLFALALRRGSIAPGRFRRPQRRVVPQGQLQRAAPAGDTAQHTITWV